MQAMFRSAVVFNQDLSVWDVSNVTNMFSMFSAAIRFNQNIGGWQVGNVRTMEYMFNHAYSFNQPLADWDVSQVTSMHGMFQNAYEFNQNIGGWVVRNVENMSAMFKDARNFNQSIDNWETPSLTNTFEMFTDSGYSHGTAHFHNRAFENRSRRQQERRQRADEEHQQQLQDFIARQQTFPPSAPFRINQLHYTEDENKKSVCPLCFEDLDPTLQQIVYTCKNGHMAHLECWKDFLTREATPFVNQYGSLHNAAANRCYCVSCGIRNDTNKCLFPLILYPSSLTKEYRKEEIVAVAMKTRRGAADASNVHLHLSLSPSPSFHSAKSSSSKSSSSFQSAKSRGGKRRRTRKTRNP